MSSAVSLALTVGPLAIYLYVIALWQSGRRPRVVSGPADYALLLFGLSGILLFGPVGWTLLGRLGPRGPSPLHWVALACSLGLLSMAWLPRAFRRIVVYNIDPATFDLALHDVLDALSGRFVKTLRGYDDPAGRRGLEIDVHARGRTVVIEAYGEGAETLIAQLRTAIRTRLSVHRPGPSVVAWGLLGASFGLIVPVLLILLTRPQIHAVWRALLHRLNGG